MSPELFEKSLGRTIHDPDILYSEQAEVDPCDFTQFGVALDCDDLSEPFAQVKGIDANPQVRSRQVSPEYRLTEAVSSLLLCSKESGGRMHSAA